MVDSFSPDVIMTPNPYTKDQLVTGLLQPCLACHVSVAKLCNRHQGIHEVYTDFPLIAIADNSVEGL